MIVYFANRKMEILGHASTGLRVHFAIVDDKRTEDVETGVTTFECTVRISPESRLELETMMDAGNYILRSDGEENEFYTIVSEDIDTSAQTISVYAENASMDLLNEIAGEYAADQAYNIAHYINKFANDTGFEIGINEIPNLTRKLSWEGESTCAARIASVATQFDNAEIGYSFAVKGMEITHKYINIYKKRGKDVQDQLRLNRDIDRIIISKSVMNLCTSLRVTGGTPDGEEKPITLSGYEYDDGDIYVSGTRLNSRSALAKWSRYVWAGEPNQQEGYTGHIIGTYTYDTTSQKELCAHAVTELKKRSQVEVNYEVNIIKLPETIKIGDRIDIVDDDGELYLSTRILRLETSVCNRKQTATLGEYLLKSSGISERVEDLAKQFSELSQSRTLYTWVAYADDANGTGISLSADNKAYMGTASNRLTKDPDLSDPSVYTWSKIQGSDAITLSITSTNGTIFKEASASTTLTAHVYRSGAELDANQIVQLGTIRWYRDSTFDVPHTIGSAVEISASDIQSKSNYLARLEGDSTIIAVAEVTVSHVRDVASTARYYLLQTADAEKPSVPDTNPPEGWSTTEPTYTDGSTDCLYLVDLTIYSDGSWEYSEVSISSSYEAAKSAYKKAENAETAVSRKNSVHYQTDAPEGANHQINDLWIDTANGNTLYIWDGTAWIKGQFGAAAIDVTDVFAQDITATGTIKGATLEGVTLNGEEIDISAEYRADQDDGEAPYVYTQIQTGMSSMDIASKATVFSAETESASTGGSGEASSEMTQSSALHNRYIMLRCGNQSEESLLYLYPNRIEIKGIVNFSNGDTPHSALEPDIVDLDDLKTGGFYVFTQESSQTIVNMPIGGTASGSVVVIPEGTLGQVRQQVTRCSAGNREIWERLWYNDAWSDWVLLYSPHAIPTTPAMTARNDTEQTLTSTTATRVNMAYSRWATSNAANFLSLTGNGIKCLKAGYVEVGAKLLFKNGFEAGDHLRAWIYQNSTALYASSIHAATSASYYTVSLSSFVVSVSAGDMIYLYGQAARANTVIGYESAAHSCQLTVKYIG